MRSWWLWFTANLVGEPFTLRGKLFERGWMVLRKEHDPEANRYEF